MHNGTLIDTPPTASSNDMGMQYTVQAVVARGCTPCSTTTKAEKSMKVQTGHLHDWQELAQGEMFFL